MVVVEFLCWVDASLTELGRVASHDASGAIEHHNINNSYTSTRDISTNDDPILDAIAAIDSAEPGKQFLYRAAAKIFNVGQETLRQQHQGQQLTCAGAANNKQNLSPQQELELVQYINKITEQGTPPTRTMIQNFGSAVAPFPCSKRWVLRFLQQNSAHLCSKWTIGMDRDRVKADSEHSYCHYFELLHAKIRQYNVEACHIYNMDKKGFLIGVTSRQKRVFSKQLWEQKIVKAGLQDGSREWITVLAAVCAGGSAIDPHVIFEAKGELCSGWVHNIEVGKHQVFFTTSPTGWSNNDIGLAWLEQVFQRCTERKAWSSYCILIADGHSTHLSREFLDYCLANKILLCILPPHSTLSLQPLDVVLFLPLLTAYLSELSLHLHCSKGLLPVKKADFFLLFWASYITSFTPENVRKAFEATGIEPCNASVVLQRFRTPTPQQDETTEIGEHGDRNSWKHIRNLLDVAVPDKTKVEAKQLSAAMHSFQVKNELLRDENEGLRASLHTKKKRANKSKTLDLQQRKEFHSLAVFWSPGTICKARVREDIQQCEEEEEKLQKKHKKELKAAHNLYQKQIAAEKRAQRQRNIEMRKKERKAKAAELVATKQRKQQERNAATTQKSHNTLNKGKRTASQSAAKISTKRHCAPAAAAEPPLPSPPTKTTMCGRKINLPGKYKLQIMITSVQLLQYHKISQ